MPESVTNAFRQTLIGALFLPQVSQFLLQYVCLYSLYQNPCTPYMQPTSNIVEPVAVRHTLLHSHSHKVSLTYQAANAMIKYIIVSNTPSSQCDLPSTIR